MVQIIMQWNKLPYSCICQNSSKAFCPCPHFTCPNSMVFHITTSQDDNLLNIFWTSSMLPHFAYISMRLESTKTFNSQPLWMIYPWTCLPSSLEPKPTHALITQTKVNLSRFIPSLCTCWKSWIALSGFPSLTHFVSFLFHAKMFNYIVSSATTPSLLPPMASFIG